MNEQNNITTGATNAISNEFFGAALYYVGAHDGTFLALQDFPEDVVKAKKAYVTLNTIMGGATSEQDRFHEGKKQTPGLLTPLGVKKMVSLYTSMFSHAVANRHKVGYETVRACRQTEVSEGTNFVGALTSTTKLSVDEIMALGYGNKNGLAICRYKFHDGAVILDMESALGERYPKPDEREVLILTGNKLVASCVGYDARYLGKDGEPALMYEIDVYPPEFTANGNIAKALEAIVYNPDTINEVRQFFTELNNFGAGFPKVPGSYNLWKLAFQMLVRIELSKLL